VLTTKEKENLYIIISSIIGEDHSIKTYQNNFNKNTVEVVENMFSANKQCNENIKYLLTNLVGGLAITTKGWLSQVLKKSTDEITKITLKGYGCLSSTKSRWKPAIIISTT